jgi:thiol-disulfide isomerase/thioredoxin
MESGLLAAALLVASDRPLTPVDEHVYRQVVERHRGEVLVVDFWATWCPPCVEELPRLVVLARRYRSRGIRLITVSCDDPEQELRARKFLDQARAPSERYIQRPRDTNAFINAVDSAWSGALPGVFVYRVNSELAQAFIGEADFDEVTRLLDRLGQHRLTIAVGAAAERRVGPFGHSARV